MDTLTLVEKQAGAIKLYFPGQWFLFDARVRVYVNKEYVGTGSMKHGFAFLIPITAPQMDIALRTLYGVRAMKLKVTDLKDSSYYRMKLDYKQNAGTFSKDFTIEECSETDVALSTAEYVSNGLVRSMWKYNLKRGAVVLGCLALLVGYLNSMSAGSYFGRYDYAPPKNSYVSTSDYNTYLELYENMELRYHTEAPYTGLVNRWGHYSINEDQSAIEVVFNDGGPEKGILQLEKTGENWKINIGESEYVKNKKVHESNFKHP